MNIAFINKATNNSLRMLKKFQMYTQYQNCLFMIIQILNEYAYTVIWYLQICQKESFIKY